METTVDVGGVEVEARAPEDQRRAMEELLRRIRERDGDPRQNARDYAAELAGGMGPVLAPAMATPGQPAPTPAAPQAAQSPTIPTPPPAQQLAQPAPTPAPQPPPAEVTPHDSTNPTNPTITAGSQAAALAPPGAPMPASPTTPAQAAQATQQPAGATQAKSLPMGGGTSGIQARMGAGPGLVAQQPSFEDRLGAAREEDVRRERIRRLLLGAGAFVGAGTGHMGLMLPAAIAAGMVRRPDEEATLRAGDEREQALGAEQARQRALLDQLSQRREAQQAQERQAQETLALRARELQGTEADRSLRTGVVLQENEREGAMLDPASAVSERNRTQFREWLRTAPREIQQAVDLRSLDGLSATEILTLQDELSSNYNSRQIGGGRGGGLTNPDGTPIGGGTGPRPGQLVNEAPRSHVLTVVNRIGNGTPEGGTYENPSEYAFRVANAEWAAMTERQRQDARADVMGQEQAGRQVPGFTAADNVAESDTAKAREVHAAARRLTSALATMIAISEDASLADRVRAGVNVGEDAARYRSARQSVITAIRTVRGLGTPQGQELAQLEAEIESMSSLGQLLNGADGLRAARDQFANDALITMESYGYRPTQGGNPLIMGPMRTAQSDEGDSQDAPPAPGPESRGGGTVRMVRVSDGVVRDIPIPANSSRAAVIAAGARNGYRLPDEETP